MSSVVIFNVELPTIASIIKQFSIDTFDPYQLFLVFFQVIFSHVQAYQYLYQSEKLPGKLFQN